MLWNAHCRIPSQAPCRTAPGQSVSLSIPPPCLPGLSRLSPPCPQPLCGSHQRRGPLWTESACWCVHPMPYLTQERIELIPAQHGVAARGDILCLQEETCPASFLACPLPAPLWVRAGDQVQSLAWCSLSSQPTGTASLPDIQLQSACPSPSPSHRSSASSHPSQSALPSHPAHFLLPGPGTGCTNLCCL